MNEKEYKGLFEIKECEMEERKYHRNRIDDALWKQMNKKMQEECMEGIWNVRNYNTWIVEREVSKESHPNLPHSLKSPS